MPARTTVFIDPETKVLWRWCTWTCGRALTLDNFYASGNGYVDTRCKDCKRQMQSEPKRLSWRRKHWRNRYYADAAFRAKSIELCREWRRKK